MARSEHGFDGVEQVLIQTGDGCFHGSCFGAYWIGIEETGWRVQAEQGESMKTFGVQFRGEDGGVGQGVAIQF